MNARVILITGASRGVGAATAHHLASADTHVVTYREKARRANDVVDSIITAGGSASALRLDVCNPTASFKGAIPPLLTLVAPTVHYPPSTNSPPRSPRPPADPRLHKTPSTSEAPTISTRIDQRPLQGDSLVPTSRQAS